MIRTKEFVIVEFFTKFLKVLQIYRPRSLESSSGYDHWKTEQVTIEFSLELSIASRGEGTIEIV